MAVPERNIHLSDVDKSTHKVLVAECRNGLLGLLPCSIFHNTVHRPVSIGWSSEASTGRENGDNLPASLQIPVDNVPIRQSNDSIKGVKHQGGIAKRTQPKL